MPQPVSAVSAWPIGEVLPASRSYAMTLTLVRLLRAVALRTYAFGPPLTGSFSELTAVEMLMPGLACRTAASRPP